MNRLSHLVRICQVQNFFHKKFLTLASCVLCTSCNVQVIVDNSKGILSVHTTSVDIRNNNCKYRAMTKPTEEVVIFKLHEQAKAKAKQTVKESNGYGVKGRARSISRVFSRISSIPSATPALSRQELVDAKGHLNLTPRSGTGTANMNRVVSKVFSLESEEGVVITSTRKVEDKKISQAQVFEVVVTSDRKANELRDQDDVVAKSNSTPLTISSHEDNSYCDTLYRSQLQKDALLLASTKQAVQPARAKCNDYVGNTSTPDTFIIDVDKKTTGTTNNKESGLFEEEDGGTGIFHTIGGAVDACSMRLCFERDEEHFIVIVPKGFCVDVDDDVSTISGLQ